MRFETVHSLDLEAPSDGYIDLAALIPDLSRMIVAGDDYLLWADEHRRALTFSSEWVMVRPDLKEMAEGFGVFGI